MEIAEFLLARIAEDEAVAREAGVSPDPEQWALWVLDDDYRHDTVCVSASRALAECEAKRQIVAEHPTIRAAYPGTTIETDPCCDACSAGGEYPGEFPCQTLRLLAMPYADHPDYDRAWAPHAD